MVSAFLDTNVILNWLSISKLDQEQRKKFKKDITRKYMSYELIEKIIKNKENHFYISKITQAEMIRLISEKLCWNRMSRDGAPSYDFFYYYPKMEISSEEINEILAGAAILDSLIEMKILSKGQETTENRDEDSLLTISLIGELRLEVHDTVLICEAVKNKCEYFVTDDTRLIDKGNRIKEIRIIRPQRFLEILQW